MLSWIPIYLQDDHYKGLFPSPSGVTATEQNYSLGLIVLYLVIEHIFLIYASLKIK